MNNNIDMNKLISMLSKMDKKDLEKGFSQAMNVLGNKDKEEILKKLGNLQNGKNWKRKRRMTDYE